MPIFIEQLSAQVTMHSGEIPLTPAQLDQIADHVLRRLAERQRDERRSRIANGVRASALPRAHDGEGTEMQLAPLVIEILDTDAIDGGRGLQQRMEVQYNPTQYSLSKSAQIAEIAIPGLDAPIQQFIRGQTEKLTVELLFDTTAQGMGVGATDVRTLTGPMYELVRIQPKTHAPPRLRVTWGHSGLSFKAIVETIDQKFVLFSPEGIPLRATLTMTFRGYATLRGAARRPQARVRRPDQAARGDARGEPQPDRRRGAGGSGPVAGAGRRQPRRRHHRARARHHPDHPADRICSGPGRHDRPADLHRPGLLRPRLRDAAARRERPARRHPRRDAGELQGQPHRRRQLRRDHQQLGRRVADLQVQRRLPVRSGPRSSCGWDITTARSAS